MKIVISDFDGTLYFGYDIGFKKEDLEAIKNSKNIIFGICTGRPLSHIVSKVDGFIDWKFIAASSGAYIIDKNKNVLYENTINKEILKKFVNDYSSRCRIDFQSQDREAYTYLERGNFREPQFFFTDISKIDDTPINQIGVHPKSFLEVDRLLEDFNKNYFDYLSFNKNEKDIDVNSKGISKKSAVKIIKSLYQNSNIFVVGDNYNDLPMFEETENSVCFDYSPKEVKENAKFVVSSLKEAINLIDNY